MFHVEAVHRTPRIQGYTLKSSILRYGSRVEPFPRLDIGGGMRIASVPTSLPLSTFMAWLDSGSESPWLPADYLESIRKGQRPPVGPMIRQAIGDHEAAWHDWVSEIKSQGRENSCSLDEWLAFVAGGRDMWSFRAERLFSEPSEHSHTAGWVLPNDVLHWTGHVRFNNQEPKYKLWYEVELTKMDRELKGWYKAGILDEFFVPTALTDLSIPQNRDRVFDLTRGPLRPPADPDIATAKRRGRGIAQYIDVRPALGWAMIHHNLCGQFCVAALGGTDVIPLLRGWMAASPRARSILEKDHGTSLIDLQSVLGTLNRPYEYFRSESGVAPITPGYVRRRLDAGRMAILGTGITSRGAIRVSSRIRHWVVIEDILQVGSSGWVRLYNPFTNLDEVYPFEKVFGTTPWSVFGLWVEPSRVRSALSSGAEVPQAALIPA